MFMNSTGIKIFILLLLTPFYCRAQEDRYFRYHYTDENGFLQNTAYQIIVNKERYAWILTEYGAARTDGTLVKNYLNTIDFKLPEERITNILWDYKGNIYGSNEHNKTRTFKFTVKPEELKSVDTAFFHSVHQQVFFIDSAKNDQQQKTLSSLLKNNQQFYYTPDQAFYFFKPNAVVYCDLFGKITEIPLKKNSYVFPVDDYLLIVNDRLHYEIINAGKITKAFSNGSLLSDTLFSGPSPRFFLNTSGSFFVKENNLYKLEVNSTSVTCKLLIKELNIPDISSVFVDHKEHIVFVSSSTDGLYAYRKQFFKTILSGLNQVYINNFYAHVELPDSSLFSANAWIDAKGLLTPQTCVRDIRWSGLITDAQDNIIFSDSTTLYKMTACGTIKKLTGVTEWVRSFAASGKRIWYASATEFGYVEHDSVVKLYERKNVSKPLPAITSLLVSGEDVWVGTKKGLYIYKPNQKKIVSLNEVEGKYVSVLKICSDKSIFIGTKGQGAFLFYKGRSIALPLDKKNALATVNAVLVDTNRFLWISTNRGLLKASIKEMENYAGKRSSSVYYHYYYKEDGFATNEFNGGYFGCAIIKKNGFFSFASLKGLVWFDPYQIPAGNFAVQPRIEGLKVDHTPILQTSGRIKLPAGYNRFSVEVSVPFWGNNDNLDLSYHLSGGDSKWFPVDASGIIYFNKLQHGSYLLEVRARTGYGEEDFLKTQLNFEVCPAWYETIVFRLSMVFLILILLFFLFRWRIRAVRREKIKLDKLVKEKTLELNNTVEQLANQKKEIEQKNTFITDSIDYAKTIQESLQPTLKETIQLFPQSFIFSKPKAIVSGDFVWLGKSSDRQLCAVVDCTGHGVPGAFMSLLGYNILENIINKHSVTTPAFVLDELSKELLSRLSKDESAGTMKHGMDLSIISIDRKNHLLEFAGAHNAVYIVRDQQLIELKADKIGIGAARSTQLLAFSNQQIELKDGDMIYLFTDGFPDQIGGPDRKKFYYKPFKELLIAISTMELSLQQAKLNEVHTRWMGSKADQTDDILIMGIRYEIH
jgi:serine phosphatase RsbU (regulator of sigma subunit)